MRNGPSTLYRLVWDGLWVPAAADDWGTGKTLTCPDGVGGPDSEGVTRAEAAAKTARPMRL